MEVNGKIEQFDRVRREFSQARGEKSLKAGFYNELVPE